MAPSPPLHTPFSQGPVDFAIGLRPIGAERWLEGGEVDPAARKDPLFEQCRETVWGETSGSQAGQDEVLSLVRAAGIGVEERPELPALYRAARALPDDLCLMEPRSGAWRLTALSLSSPTFFTAAGVLGKNLSELHGPVPDFQARFLARVERIFQSLPADVILERRNWTVVNTGDLFTPDPAPIRARVGEIPSAQAGAHLHIRVERQTLRRLPVTGGAVFTIRVWPYPLDALKADPGSVAAFASAWRNAPGPFRQYKQLHLYDQLVEAFLRASGE
jgi:hypothetical protein